MPIQEFRAASPNNGYLYACALMCEHAIKFIVRLNYDLAIVSALSQVGTTQEISIILGPENHDHLGMVNIIFLHRSANEIDPERWIIRTDQLEAAWRGAWQEVMITHVAAIPVIVFAGIGTLVPSVSETTRRISYCLNAGHQKYQVDTDQYERSSLAQSIDIRRDNFIQLGWCEFMRQLALRVAIEQIDGLEVEYTRHVQDNQLAKVSIERISVSLRSKDLIELGQIRGCWLTQMPRYMKYDRMQQPLWPISCMQSR